MAITKTWVTFCLAIILVYSLSNHNVLTSGAEMEKVQHKYTFCAKSLCTDSYSPRMCFVDCVSKGFLTGDCITPPNSPLRCCCANE
ncbi:hypothetical protein HID58_006710 [Brassica napus]|uniref:BnaA02g22850D protein n=2 Tax=Brassica napus TaxID=3708 RepID=A0A078FRK1_BRANA|nr:hypothetical protein HID58_006710 [Brassica napus]CAF2142112.1 unnamed protein product [Brassica napus]CDY14943.1 BnaA02g22850D [Brassica napus]